MKEYFGKRFVEGWESQHKKAELAASERIKTQQDKQSIIEAIHAKQSLEQSPAIEAIKAQIQALKERLGEAKKTLRGKRTQQLLDDVTALEQGTAEQAMTMKRMAIEKEA